ncbi:hypothetical protein QU42_06265 [Bradyrhizobium sp. UASWS1016]|nr:hypothetical protein QU41_11615 [Bradyrhizobium elkanii]OCX31849.1 hypothetical protein QU42_06265 [Bradyrhizobium sp. UASWS1016]
MSAISACFRLLRIQVQCEKDGGTTQSCIAAFNLTEIGFGPSDACKASCISDNPESTDIREWIVILATYF